MDARELRRKELAEKKRRLAELKRANKQHAEASASASTQERVPPSAVEPTRNVVEQATTTNVDALVEELLGPTAKVDIGKEEQPLVSREVAKIAPARKLNLTVVTQVYSRHVSPASNETYSKGTQTDDVEVDEPLAEIGTSPMSPQPTEKKHTASTPVHASKIANESEEPKPHASTQPAKPLSQSERELVEKSGEFLSFIEQSTRVVERTIALNTSYDVTIDYGGEGSLPQAGGNSSVRIVSELLDPNVTKDKSVSCLGWSEHFSELFLAGYSRRDRSPDADWRTNSSTDGLVQVWNMKASERPEYVFTCQSEVETAMFNPFMPSVILAGTYSGEVVMWDMRAKRTPVQRSSLASDGHMHPVFAMECVGTANAHSLVSVSTDGRMCLWSLSSMAAPTESRMLQSDGHDVAVTAISFPTGESNDFCVGAEDGKVHRAQVHGSKAGLQKEYPSHFGPITAVDFHRCKGGSGVANDLLLSSSMDWTVKLWSHRHGQVPLKTFESASDYVYDVQWSPVHPALFASVDGSGVLDLWNLTQDLEVPVEKLQISSSSALSCLHWSPDGKNVVVGDSHGKLTVANVASEVAVPKRDAWGNVEDLVSSLVEDMDKDPAGL